MSNQTLHQASSLQNHQSTNMNSDVDSNRAAQMNAGLALKNPDDYKTQPLGETEKLVANIGKLCVVSRHAGQIINNEGTTLVSDALQHEALPIANQAIFRDNQPRYRKKND